MATQTGSIDLTASNSVKLMADAGFESVEENYYTKAELDVTVQGINTEVSKKVNGTEIISTINQSAESVSINASKINLTGAVTISDLASDAQNATLNSKLSVGGRNLLGGTANPTIPTGTNSDAIMTFRDIGRYNSPMSEFSIENYDDLTKTIIITSTVTGNRGVGWYTKAGAVKSGESYTFSCKVKANVSASVHTHTAWRNGSATAGYTGWTSGGALTIAANTWTDYSYTFTPSSSASLDYEFYVAVCFTGQTGGVTFRTSHAKLEKGNKATDWTVAPEEFSEVGGRNLLLGTGDWSEWYNEQSDWSFANGIATSPAKSSLIWAGLDSTGIPLDECYGRTFTLSFDYRSDDFSDTSGNPCVYINVKTQTTDASTSSRKKYRRIDRSCYVPTTDWQRAEITFTLGDDESWFNVGTAGGSYLAFSIYNYSLNQMQLRHVKLERGTMPTDWTPAPEDTAATATSYVTEITGQNGIMVHPSTDQTTGVQITDDVDILRGGTSVINIGTNDAVRVGSASGGHIAIDSDSMDFWASAAQLAMRFTGRMVNNPNSSVYLAKIEDGVTRENEDYNDNSYISLYTLEEPTYQGSDEKVVTESMATMHAYARGGEGTAEISIFMHKDPDANTASRGAIIASDRLTCEGTTNVGDPYGDVDGLNLGDPARVTSSKSSTASTSDTMGPDVVLTAGKWLVMGNWNFLNSSSNAKRLVVGLYRNATGQAYTYRVHTTASSSSSHRLEVVDTIVLTSDETITLYGASSPASTSAGTQWISAIRLT